MLLRLLLLFSAMAILLSCSNNVEDELFEVAEDSPIELRSLQQNYKSNPSVLDVFTLLENPHIEIYFLLSDGANFHDEHTAQFALPEIARQYGGKISTSEVTGHEPLLAQYYQQIFTAAKSHDTAFSQISHLFWLRLTIQDSDGSELYNFSYYDTLGEIARFQEWVEQRNEDVGFLDLDQGWAIDAIVRNGLVYLDEYDPDSNRVSVNRAISYDVLNSELKLSVERAQKIITTLSESLGTDVWSTYRGYEWDNVTY